MRREEPQSFWTAKLCYLAFQTPQGFDVNSRGQGHALCARRPRIGIERPGDPEGVELDRPTPSGPIPAPAPVSAGLSYSSSSPPGNEGTVKPLPVSLVKPAAYFKDSYCDLINAGRFHGQKGTVRGYQAAQRRPATLMDPPAGTF